MKRAAVIVAIVLIAAGVGVAVKKCPPAPVPGAQGPDAPKAVPPVVAPVTPAAPPNVAPVEVKAAGEAVAK
jgi:hypothetical protein